MGVHAQKQVLKEGFSATSLVISIIGQKVLKGRFLVQESVQVFQKLLATFPFWNVLKPAEIGFQRVILFKIFQVGSHAPFVFLRTRYLSSCSVKVGLPDLGAVCEQWPCSFVDSRYQ